MSPRRTIVSKHRIGDTMVSPYSSNASDQLSRRRRASDSSKEGSAPAGERDSFET